ncbi:MAG: flippase-like domain-containing protein [Firmicutes bacterium]|nr:flippase-like domain-containing protein [Bacillota bacterium]
MKKIAVNYIVVILLIIATIWIISSNNELSQMPNVIENAHKEYIIMGILSLVGFWITDASILNLLIKRVYSKINIFKALKFTMVGQYYSNITPFSSGGQPAQIYTMIKDNIPMGKATSIMICKFIIYQLVVTFYSIAMFIMKINFVFNNIKMALPFVILGIVLNFLGILIIFILFFNPKIIRKLTYLVFNFLHRIKLMKRPKKYEHRVDKHLEEYILSTEEIKNNLEVSFKIGLITIIQLTFRFSITYFVYLALGFTKASFIDILAIQSFLYMAVSFMPTPGTVGASEGGFYLIFKVFFTSNILAYAMLLWRGISYYLNLLVSGLVTLIDYILRKRKEVLLDK